MVEPLSLSMASLAAFRDTGAALADAVRGAWGVALPTTPKRIEAGDLAFIWAGRDRWLVTAPEGFDIEARLRDNLGALAAVTDQGAGRVTFRVSGADVRGNLAKLVGIDLHPRAFAPGDTALTIAAHINLHLWQIDAAPTYDLTVFRSLAASFEHALHAAGV